MSDTSSEQPTAVDRLKVEGVPGATATRRVAEHGAERCLSYADALDAPGAHAVKNRADWLRMVMRRGWELPTSVPR